MPLQKKESMDPDPKVSRMMPDIIPDKQLLSKGIRRKRIGMPRRLAMRRNGAPERGNMLVYFVVKVLVIVFHAASKIVVIIIPL